MSHEAGGRIRRAANPSSGRGLGLGVHCEAMQLPVRPVTVRHGDLSNEHPFDKGEVAQQPPTGRVRASPF